MKKDKKDEKDDTHWTSERAAAYLKRSVKFIYRYSQPDAKPHLKHYALPGGKLYTKQWCDEFLAELDKLTRARRNQPKDPWE